jgi:raffinose/stachyose/melibiose transport system substrate-binding protein
MKFKKKSIMSLAIAGVLSASLLAGCSSSSSTKPEEKSKGGDSKLSGNVVFWSMWSDTEPQALVIQDAVEDFEKANPKVEVELKFQGREINKIIKPALEGGQAIDIFEQDPANAIANLGPHLLKLDDYLNKPAVGMDGKTVKESLQPALMDWVKSLAVPAGLEDGYYSIPQQPYAVLFFYNKDLFNKAGITSVPETWADFVAANEKLKASGIEPITFDDAYRDQFIGGYLSSAMGSEWVDQLVKDKTGDMWKDPIVLQFAKDIEDLRNKGLFSTKIAGNKYPAGQQDLALGKVGMYLNGTWLPNEVSATAGPDFNWGSFQFPTIENGNGKGGHQGLSFGAQGLLINKDSKNSEAAFELVKYLVSKTAQQGMAENALAIPATIDTEWPKALTEAKVAFDNAKVNMPWGFGIDNAGDFSSGTVMPVFMELVTGKINAAQYTEKMASEAKKFYAGQ